MKMAAKKAMAEILEGPTAISLGVEFLRTGKLVAFPTETVYGLGADALNSEAVESVFALKGRPSTNPLIVHVSGIEMAKSVVADWPIHAQQIADAFWPGPITIVLPKQACVPDIVSANGATVAVRCPEHPCALALIESFGGPIVGPSANPSGRISPTIPEHVADGFADADLLIIDGGHCRAGIESTVVDLSGDTVRVLRQGIIGAHAISEVIGEPVHCIQTEQTDSVTKSPGLIGPHYQPRTLTRTAASQDLSKASPDTIIIAHSIDSHPAAGLLIKIPDSIKGYASSMYRSLHQADEAALVSNGNLIWIELPETGENEDDYAIRRAIMERLNRATHQED